MIMPTCLYAAVLSRGESSLCECCVRLSVCPSVHLITFEPQEHIEMRSFASYQGPLITIEYGENQQDS